MVSTASIGPYQILSPLGQGGMGVVYRARHAATGEAAAIKTVRVPAPRWLESIRREIDALTRIRHPGIVRIREHGVHEGLPWYAMDLLEGESLREFGVRIWSAFKSASSFPGPRKTLTVTEPLSDAVDISPNTPSGQPMALAGLGDAPAAAGALAQVLSLVRRMCATLAFLHGEGVVSCDLKPENVLIVDGAPVLIDFGLSQRFPAATGREAIDVQRSIAGTLPYMSPEQLRGELVDARSDLYSIGLHSLRARHEHASVHGFTVLHSYAALDGSAHAAFKARLWRPGGTRKLGASTVGEGRERPHWLRGRSSRAPREDSGGDATTGWLSVRAPLPLPPSFRRAQ